MDFKIGNFKHGGCIPAKLRHLVAHMLIDSRIVNPGGHSMFDLPRRCLIIVLVVSLVPGIGSASKKDFAPPGIAVSATLTPTLNKRPIMGTLALFGKLLRIVYTAGGERELIVEIAPILNKSGVDKDLPNELSQWLREAISQIGYPLRSYEAVPTSILVRPIYAGPGPTDHPPHPPLNYRVTGVLARVFERQIQGKELEFYLRAGGGKTSADGQMKRSRRATLTRVTVSLTLEQPDGLDLATATYFVDLVKTEFDQSWGLFLGGTGFGGGRNFMMAGDPGDAIFDAASAALMTVLGRAPETLAPYYHCDSIFPEDETLNELERHRLNRMTENELRSQIKPYLFLSNIASMDMKTPLVTPTDLEMIAGQMHIRQLNPTNRYALASYAYALWHDIPIEQASEQLEKRIEEVIVIRKTRAEQEAEVARDRARLDAETKVRLEAEAESRKEVVVKAHLPAERKVAKKQKEKSRKGARAQARKARNKFRTNASRFR